MNAPHFKKKKRNTNLEIEKQRIYAGIAKKLVDTYK